MLKKTNTTLKMRQPTQPSTARCTYFQEMLNEVITWEIKPSHITGDSWYSSKENLKHIKKADYGLCLLLKPTEPFQSNKVNGYKYRKKVSASP